MKNNNLTLLDPNQIQQLQYDQDHDAQRVIIVGDNGSRQIADTIKESLKDIKIEIPEQKQQESLIISVPTIVKEIEIREVEKTILIPDYKVFEVEKTIVIPQIKIVEIEKPIIVPEYRTIETPIIVREQQIERIEVPVIVKQNEPMSTFIKTILIIQTLGVLARVFFEIIRH